LPAGGGRATPAAPSLCDDARMSAARSGDGWAATTLDDLGEGPGFRKIRPAIGVTAFGINAIVLPVGIESGRHYHDRQEEVYFVHRGRVEIEFGDGGRVELGPGGVARVDAATVRQLRNVGEEDAVYVVVGGADGYVGRDGRLAEGETGRAHQTAPPSGA
jgi:mannose-6-phosphate isomerase-like protein (cupin superfamily)